jgi:hypothetical protein
MANPTYKNLKSNTWTLVAENVTAGFIRRLSNKPNKYTSVYRETGDAAPTNRTEGIHIFLSSNSEEISATSGIDVYIMAVGNRGKVRVDLP